MSWVKFLIVAVVVMAVCIGGIGGWLLPQFGISGSMAQMIGAAVGGALVAVLMLAMKPGREA